MSEAPPARATTAELSEPSPARFKDLVRPHLPRLYGLARHLVGDEGEDAVQECLLKAYRRFGQLRDPEAIGGWLRQILLNHVRDRARHAARQADETPVEQVDEGYSLYRKLAEEDPLPYSDSLHLDFLSCVAVPDVWAVLDRLPPHYRTPLVLVHMYQVPTKEVATALDVPLNTLLSHLHRGRKLFERELWDYAVEHDLLREPQEVLQ